MGAHELLSQIIALHPFAVSEATESFETWPQGQTWALIIINKEAAEEFQSS